VRIIFPLSTPIVATIGVFAAVGQWNTFVDALFLVREQRLWTLQMLLYQYLQRLEAVSRVIRTGTMAGAANVGGCRITPTAARMTVSMSAASSKG
jgi:ABC-type glycerol-3-phosphate transport system permease component